MRPQIPEDDVSQHLSVQARLQRLESASNIAMLDWIVVGSVGGPAYQNGWRQFLAGGVGAEEWTPVRFRKDPLGKVAMYGLVDKAGGNWIAHEVIFSLPAEYVPYQSLILEQPCASAASTSMGTAQVYVGGQNGPTPGAVSVWDHGGAVNPVSWLSLNMPIFDTGLVTVMP